MVIGWAVELRTRQLTPWVGYGCGESTAGAQVPNLPIEQQNLVSTSQRVVLDVPESWQRLAKMANPTRTTGFREPTRRASVCAAP
jgi:hypothetical protein